MFHFSRLSVCAGLLASAVAILPFSTSARAAETQYPLTIKNCGLELTFKQAPSRTVSVG